MRTILSFFAVIVLLTACTNSTTSTPTEGADSITLRDTTTYRDTTNVETNTVTPPASNGQF